MTIRERMEVIAQEFHFDLSDAHTFVLCLAFAWQDKADELRAEYGKSVVR